MLTFRVCKVKSDDDDHEEEGNDDETDVDL